MSKVLEKIFIDGCGTTNNLSSDVTVLVAAVDGLPPRNQKTMGNGLQVTEGFAFLSCDQELVLPRIWEQDNLNDLADEGYSQRPSIVFRMSSGSSLKGVLDIGVPLANTMFRNGRTSTLLASSWHRNNASGQFEKVKQVERKSMIIYPASANSMIPLRLEIPLVPLTPFRRVVSGLGNILRQVTDAHGKVVSASQELEASVDTYLDARKLQKQAVAVWALITPNSEMVDKKNEDILATDQDRIRASWTNTAEQGLLPYVGSWIKQGRGGTLHRVCKYKPSYDIKACQLKCHILIETVSGGGGWGLKQGLLSLDPDTTLLKSTDARHDFDSDDPGDNEHVQALGKIAKPGSWVQFLVSHHSTSETHIATVGLNNSNLDSEFINCLSFGCIPSTVDDTSQSLSDPSISSDEKDFHRSVDGLEGHFGAMSEGGIFICANEKDAVTSSKIDVPYSIFQWGLIKREKS